MKNNNIIKGTLQILLTEKEFEEVSKNFEYTIKARRISVCTDMMNVTAEVIADIYKARWSIEIFFRFIKQNLNLSKIFGTTENSVYNQLFVGIIT